MSKMPSVLAKSTQGYGYKYTELAEINKSLGELGMTYRQYVEPLINGDAVIDYLFTILIDKEGNESEPIRGCRIVGGGIGKNAAQDQGAAITYARRYSLMMALGLACEDDDASSLTKSEPKMPAAASKRKNGLDFKEINNEVDAINDVEELRRLYARKYSKGLTEKQKTAVLGIFKQRTEILEGDPDPTDEELEAL